MSIKTIEFVENGQYTLKHNHKLSTDVENEAIDEEIDVENVIRRLRQKKSLEVKKVNDMDSKLIQISPLRDGKAESKEFNQGKSAVINLDSYQDTNAKSVVEEQNNYSVRKTNSMKITNFLEIEDDEIEDYLEIDQNIVKDLEALIPEEEIVSISNSLIQPEEQISTKSLESTIIPETKYEKIEIPASVSFINASDECKDPKYASKYQEIELKIKHDIDSEDKVEINSSSIVEINDEDIVKIGSVCREDIISNKNSPESVKINNNESNSQTKNETPTLSSLSVEKSEHTLEEESRNLKLHKSHQVNKARLKKTDSRNNKKIKLNSDLPKNFRKITDFLVPNPVKKADLNQQNTKVEETSPNSKDASSEVINLDEEELPVETRTLRSKSKTYLKESKTQEFQAIDEMLTKSSEDKIEFPKTSSVVVVADDNSNDSVEGPSKMKKVTTISLDASESETESNIQKETKFFEKDVVYNVDECEMKNEESTSVIMKESTNAEDQSQAGKEDTSIEILPKIVEPEGIDDVSKKEEQQISEIESSSNPHESINVVTNNNETEEKISPETSIVVEIKNETKDNNENHVYPGSAEQEENIDISESQNTNENQQKRRNTKQTRKNMFSNGQEQEIVEITSDMNNEEDKRNEKRPEKRENKKNEGRQKRRKKQSRIRNRKKISKQKEISDNVDNKSEKTVDKNKETKLEIYDFDDKSNEEIELLKKSSKKRKNEISKVNKIKRQDLEETPTEKRRKLDNDNNRERQTTKTNSKTSVNTPKNHVEPENNKQNTIQGSIKNIVQSSENSSKTNNLTENVSCDGQPKHEDDKIKIDSNTSTSGNIISKTSPESKPVGEEGCGQNWKPVYGPYKRIDRCNVCLIAFKSYKKLRAHKKIHEVENPYNCTKCDQSFEDVEKLAAHLRIHKGKMPFACKKCDATFWTSFQLDKHQLVHVLKKVPAPSKPPSKVFKCEECGKEFKKICDLERHTRVHTGEKPSVCNICNKRFQQAYNLNKHLYTHTQEKNFECVICQKKFGRNDVLNRHVLTHSIIKPFRCSLCSKTFIRNSQLKLHLQKRHGLDEDPGSGTSAVDDPVASTSTSND